MFKEDKAYTYWIKNFGKIYDKVNYTNSLQSYVMRAGHKLLEKYFLDSDYFENVLEVGGGPGNISLL
jgi:hypothetical protein